MNYIKSVDKFMVEMRYLTKEYKFCVTFDTSDGSSNEVPDEVRCLFEEGNFSCDCNKSALIRQYCDADFPEMDCGDSITLLTIEPVGN